MKISMGSVTLFVLLIAISSINLFADTYHSANFSGQLFSSVNIKAPFSGTLFGSDPVSGNFVYDDQLKPGSGTGFVNVFLSSFPDVSVIPSATAFSFHLGTGLDFDLANALPGQVAVQYNNGNFNGFFYVSDFMFQGNPYELQVQGGVFNVRALDNQGYPTGSNLVSGALFIGNGSLSNTQVYDPRAPIPEPLTLVLLGSGFALLARKLKM